MNPDSPQPPQNVDYLNLISTPTNRSGKFGSKFNIILMILGGVVVLTIIFLVVTSFSGGSTSNIEKLSARLKAIEAISTSAQPNIKSTKLRAANSSLNIYMKDVNTSLNKLAPSGVNTAKLPKSITNNEALTQKSITDDLAEAKLLGQYDAVYSQSMTNLIGFTILDMQKLSKSTNSESFKKFLDDTSNNLQTTSDNIKNYSSATN